MELIDVQKVPFGWEQRFTWRHPDRYEEDVADFILESPLVPPTVTPETHVCTFLVTGDQNAGKTTFLHLLCCCGNISAFPPSDLSLLAGGTCPVSPLADTIQNVLELGSFLPILASSFVNTRWIDCGSENEASVFRDKFPYIDTDLGRAFVLFGGADFHFLLNEFELAPPLPTATPFYGLHFIEIGGDHLDRLIQQQQCEQRGDITVKESESQPFHEFLNKTLRRTNDILQESDQILYFLNVTSLVSVQGPTCPPSLRPEAFRRLVQRVAICATTQVALHVFCSLVPPESEEHGLMVDEALLTASWIETIVEVLSDYQTSPKTLLSNLLHASFQSLLHGTSVPPPSISAFERPFYDAWGQTRTDKILRDIRKNEESLVFRYVKALILGVFGTREQGGLGMFNCKISGVHFTRNYETSETGELTISVHGVVSTVVRLLDALAIRSASKAGLDMELVVLQAFVACLSTQADGVVQNAWLTRANFADALQQLDDIHSNDPSLQQTDDVCYFRTAVAAVPLQDIVTLWPVLSGGLVRAQMVWTADAAASAYRLNLVVILMCSDGHQLRIAPKREHVKTDSTALPSPTEGHEIAIRLPRSPAILASWVSVLRENVPRHGSLPATFWCTVLRQAWEAACGVPGSDFQKQQTDPVSSELYVGTESLLHSSLNVIENLVQRNFVEGSEASSVGEAQLLGVLEAAADILLGLATPFPTTTKLWRVDGPTNIRAFELFPASDASDGVPVFRLVLGFSLQRRPLPSFDHIQAVWLS